MDNFGFPIPPLNPGRTSSSQGHWGVAVTFGIPGVPGSVQGGGFNVGQNVPGAPIAAQVKPLPLAALPVRGRAV